MIKIFTDTSFITSEYRSIIFPLLFDLCYIPNLGLLEKYILVDSIEASDIVIVPVDISFFYKNNKTHWLKEFITNGNQANKKVWIYTAGDFGITLNEDVFTFRFGGFRSKVDGKTFILPCFISNPYAQLDIEFKPIPKIKLPKIGFVGHASGSFIKWGKEYLAYLKQNLKRIIKFIYTDYQAFYPSSYKRYQFLTALEKSQLIETNFIFRNKYRAGVKSELEKKQTSVVFFENIATNPYVFCLRGVGNFSVRFYETLAMGRIPLVIDTDFRLPLDSLINWKNHCVMANKDNFIETLIDFHTTISDADFEQMQYNNSKLWSTYLNRDTYFSVIHDHFKKTE
jgi:hypothetical protein